MARLPISRFLLTAAASLLLGACATMGSGGGPAFEGTTWRIVQVDGVAVPRGDDIDLAPHFRILSTDGTIRGATGCNRFSGPYQATGTTVAFGPLAATRVACPGTPWTDVEARILAVIGGADGYRLDGRWLWLFVGGEHRLTAEVW